MGIVVNLYYTGQNGSALRFAQEMKEIAELREKYDLHMRVERLISDEEGVPDKDQAFIRK